MTDRNGAPARRSSATVRSLVLRAARELFDERGYEQVSTREIAARAGVTQAMVFRHFGTKSDLFVEAVCEPFYAFVTEYIGRWVDGGHGSDTPAHDTEVFVSGLYRLMLDNRNLLVALTGQLGDTRERSSQVFLFLREILARLEHEVGLEIRTRGSETMDVACAVRFAFALVYGVSVLDEALFPEGDPGADRRFVADQMAGFILRGTLVGED